MSSTRQRLTDLIAAHLRVDASKVVERAKFVDDLGADSLDVSELIMAVQDEFGVTITSDQAMEMPTVQDMLAFVEERQQ